MKRLGMVVLGAAALVAANLSPARAAVKVEERSTFELKGGLGKLASLGGAGNKEPSVTTIAVHGNRKVSTSGDTGEIVDLDEGKIYALDLKRGTYRVTTFEDLRRQVEEAKKKAAERKDGPKGEAQKPSKEDEELKEAADKVQIDVDVKSTGRTRKIQGLDTRQVVMTITAHEKGTTVEKSGGLALTSDMWLAPRVAALKELADFDQRYARKLAVALGGGSAAAAKNPSSPEAMGAMHPMLSDAFARMRAEGEKVDGSPLLTVISVDVLPSAEQRAQAVAEADAKKRRSAERSKPELGKGLGGLVGGLARQTVDRKVEEKVEEKVGAPADESQNARLLEMTTEVTAISKTVAKSDLALPAGLRLVE